MMEHTTRQGIINCLKVSKYEDAIMGIFFDSDLGILTDEMVNNILNEYLIELGKPCFSMEDYQISKNILIQKGFLQ